MAAAASVLLLAAQLCPQAWGLSAAAGKVDITPDPAARRVYMAGFGAKGRRSLGVHDPLFARLLLLRDGPRLVGLASLDLLGWSRSDVEDLRRLSGFSGPDRYLFVAATHNHSAPDTLGLWGPLPGVSGVDAAWQGQVKERLSAQLRRLEAQLQDVSLEAWSGPLDPSGLCRDLRDPAVLDPDLSALRLKDRQGRSVATLVNWSCHAEALGRENRLLSADFPGALCAQVEARTGGACLFFNGAIGGLLAPDAAAGAEGFAQARRIGSAVAGAALKGLAAGALKDRRPALAFRSRIVRVPVENSRYLLFLPALAAGHRFFDAAGRPLPRWKPYWLALRHAWARLPAGARPWVETEVSLVDLGPARLLGLPGEAFPELVIGGYDGRFRFAQPLVKPDNPAAPDLAAAPKPPYLKALLRRPVPIVVGVANDELGYIVPEYDFKVRDNLLMLPRLPGSHYEETNSVGPAATRILMRAAQDILEGHE